MDSAGRTTRRNSTMLHEAAKSGNCHAAHSLLRSDPSLAFSTNPVGDTPLHLAARWGHAKVAELLLKHSSAPAAAPPKLLSRVEDGKADSDGVSWLTRVANGEGDTALHEAARSGCGHTARLLMEADAGLGCVANKAGESPLFLAVDGSFYEIAFSILDKNCSCSGRNGMNVMHAASIRIQDKMVFSCLRTKGLASTVHSRFLDDFMDKVLNKCGLVMLEKQDKFGWTPLHYAAHIGNTEILKRILKANETLIHIKTNDEEEMSALHIATRNDQTKVIETLLGAEDYREVAELLDKEGRTALHVAVESGKSRAVKTLLRFMSCELINRKDGEGNTCLHNAAFYGHVTILIMLATNEKVDKKVVNKVGTNAIDVCESSMKLGPLETAITTAILRKKGTIPSLERSVIRGTTKTAQLTNNTIPKPTPNTRTNEALEPPRQQQINKGQIYSRQDITNMINVNLIVATIIASVAFSAAIAMPGGYGDDGKALLRRHVSFKWFLVFDSLAFASSAALMFVHFLVPLYSKFVLDEAKVYPLSWVVGLTIGSALSMVLAFVMGTVSVLDGRDLPYYDVGLAGIVVAVAFVLPVGLFLVRRVYWFVKEVSVVGLVYGVCYVLTGGKWF